MVKEDASFIPVCADAKTPSWPPIAQPACELAVSIARINISIHSPLSKKKIQDQLNQFLSLSIFAL